MRGHAVMMLAALALVGLAGCGSAADVVPVEAEPAFVPREATIAYDADEDFVDAAFHSRVEGEVAAATLACRAPGEAAFVRRSESVDHPGTDTITFGIGVTCMDDPSGTEYRLEVLWRDAAGNPTWMQQATATKR